MFYHVRAAFSLLTICQIGGNSRRRVAILLISSLDLEGIKMVPEWIRRERGRDGFSEEENAQATWDTFLAGIFWAWFGVSLAMDGSNFRFPTFC